MFFDLCLHSLGEKSINPFVPRAGKGNLSEQLSITDVFTKILFLQVVREILS